MKMICFINYKIWFRILIYKHYASHIFQIREVTYESFETMDRKIFQRVYICDRQTLSIPIFHCILMFSLQYIQAVLLPHFYWISGRHNYTATLLTFYHIKARSQRYYGFTFSAYPFMWFYCLFCFYVLQVVLSKYVSQILRTNTFFIQAWNL